MGVRAPMFIQWQPLSFSGWGVYGLNLFLEWAADGEVMPLTTAPIDVRSLVIDGLRLQRLAPFFAESQRLRNEFLRNPAGTIVKVGVPVLEALGDGVGGGGGEQIVVRGTPTIGVIFFEDTQLSEQAIERAHRYRRIITGSLWNEEVLREHGITHVSTVLQGIDPALFHPAPRTGWYRDRFVIFSGGKLAFRKAQDLVLRAFGAFAQRHPESLLVTAWHSPWPRFARSFAELGSGPPVPFNDEGRFDLRAWVIAYGIAPEQVIDIGQVANALMPTVLREADVALFPNRCEGGTNLVAMEAMACGVPCIVSRNTGHRDIMDSSNCYALERQLPVSGEGKDGWGESDVDEIVETLETVWRNRDDAAMRGACGAATMSKLSWSAPARALKETIATVTEPR
jgi:glycosyltransferase involved in cell wall biosynthesis